MAVDHDDRATTATVAHALVRVGRGCLIADTLTGTRDALGTGSESCELRALLHADLIELLAQTGPPEALLRAVAQAPAVANKADPALAARLRAAAGWAGYQAGRWDEAVGADPTLAPLIAAHRSRPAPRASRAPTTARREPAAIAAERAGRTDEALRLRHEALTRALGTRPSRLHGVEHVARLALAVGAPTADLLRDCDRVAADEGLPVQIALAQLVRAMVDGDPDVLLDAAGQLRRYGAVLPHALGLEEAAVCLARAGNRSAAGQALREAVQVFASVGALWDIERADERLRPYRIRRRVPADQPTSGWAALTPAEFRVVRLVAQGLSNRDIAATLFLSQNTVQTHLSRIRDKLGLRSRLEIARAAGFRSEAADAPPIRPRRPAASRS